MCLCCLGLAFRLIRYWLYYLYHLPFLVSWFSLWITFLKGLRYWIRSLMAYFSLQIHIDVCVLVSTTTLKATSNFISIFQIHIQMLCHCEYALDYSYNWAGNKFPRSNLHHLIDTLCYSLCIHHFFLAKHLLGNSVGWCVIKSTFQMFYSQRFFSASLNR